MHFFPLFRYFFFSFLVSMLPCAAFAQADPAKTFPTYQANRARTGWISNETALTPSLLQAGRFGPLWNSPQFDSVQIGPATYLPKLYASPLYLDTLTLSTGGTYSAVLAATSNGWLYAVDAASGAILWRTKLTNPEIIPSLDGGVPMGVLGTPVLDPSANRIYVASDDAAAGWQVFAVDLPSGRILPGWPLGINNTTLAPINRNGPTTFQPSMAMSQRGALALSPDGATLYVPFGAYGDGGAGWMVAVNTQQPSLKSAFAGAPSTVAFANGGMWSAAGPSVDADGTLYSTTGNGTTANETTPNYWAQSLLQWSPSLLLTGTYTPFNYCLMDQYDTDLAGSSPVILPDLGAANTRTPRLLAFGGKQGNLYLLDRDHLPGSTTVRQGCSAASSADRSLMPPGGQSQFHGAPGPLNIFGPYSEQYENLDYAKSRATPAFFQPAANQNYLFATGSTKQAVDSQTSVPPSLVRLKINLNPAQPAYLSIDASETAIQMLSPGSPLITSSGPANAIIWVLAGNVLRTQNLLDPSAAHPILYAFDQNLNILWNSTQAQLNAGGKYMAPAIARGQVFVGTDRIQAFGILPAATSGAVVALDSGGPAAAAFSADADFTGGHSDYDPTPIDLSTAPNPAPEAVYQTRRTGSNQVGFRYSIPNLTPGLTYTARLHFTEPLHTAAGQRIFSVAINNTVVLLDFDIYQAAGGPYRALSRDFPAVADPNGRITLDYRYGSAGNPLASGLEIIPPSVANLTQSGTILSKITAPTGGGNHNPAVIRDGDFPPAGSTDSSRQWDSYSGGAPSSDDWIGYGYPSTHTFSKVIFQEGRNFPDGGWFLSGKVQVRQSGIWVNAPNLVSTPAYPPNDGIGFETYTLTFTPISGDAIRIDGPPGGSAAFISVGELLVFGR